MMGSRCDATKKGRLSWAAGREVVIWRTRTVRTVRNRRPGEPPSETRLRPSVGIGEVWVEEVDPVQTAFLKWHRMDTTPPSPIISARPGSLNKDLLLWIGSAALSSAGTVPPAPLPRSRRPPRRTTPRWLHSPDSHDAGGAPGVPGYGTLPLSVPVRPVLQTNKREGKREFFMRVLALGPF